MIIVEALLVVAYGVLKGIDVLLIELNDINDIEKIENDIKKENSEDQKLFLGEKYREELWNQINRRTEKAKIVSLKSLDQRISGLKEWITESF